MSDRKDNHEPATSTRLGDSGTLSDRVRALRLPERMNPNVGRRSRLPWILCILLLITTVIFGVRAFGKPGGETKKPEETSSTTADSGDTVLESKGYIIPAHQIQVSPKVSGMLVSIDIYEGKKVKEGETLGEIERDDYQYDHDRAVATLKAAQERCDVQRTGNRPEEIEAAKFDLTEAEETLKQLKDDQQRLRSLFLRGAAPESDSIRANFAFLSQQGRVNRLKEQYQLMKIGFRDEMKRAAEAEVRQAEADVAKTKWRLENCTIKAPVSGTILTKKAEKGNIVNPIAFNVSASLCDMADLADLEVELTIQERDIANVVVEQKCRVMPEAFQRNDAFLKIHPKGYDGVVSRLMPIADRAKGAIPVRVKLTVPKEEEGVYLKPDMGVIVSFLKVAPAEKKEQE